MKQALFAALLLVNVTAPRCEVFKEDFSEGLDPRRWSISAWVAPHNGPKNQAEFKAANVKIVGGLLQLKLTQSMDIDGTIHSYGAEIKTVAKFGYGTYEFEMKASGTEENPYGNAGKPVSGSITGACLFADDSETEIDIEYEGDPDRAYLTQSSTWTSEKTVEQKKIRIPNVYAYWPQQRFQKYKFVWMPGKVTFYRDGELISTHTKVVPSKPAQFIFNHWGTNSRDWGGLASPDKIRYMYVKSFSFRPLDENSN